MSMNGAESLVRTLVAGGVDVSFTNPGTSEMHFVAALDRVEGMRCVLFLFEGGATGAADGYARMADKPASTLLHLGPGLGNGLANLHNAKRARSPVVNIVGEHATYHRHYDAPLASDIESIARPVSAWVRTSEDSRAVAADGAAAIAAARAAPGGVATLILPADTAWGEGSPVAPVAAAPERRKADEAAIRAAADALRSGEPAVLFLGDRTLRQEGLDLAGRIAAATGARMIAQVSNARIARGAGRQPIDRLPYPVDLAVERLAGVKHLIVLGTTPPVAFFAYPGKPSELQPPDCKVQVLAGPAMDQMDALERLADLVGAAATPPPSSEQKPALPTGRLTQTPSASRSERSRPREPSSATNRSRPGRNFFPRPGSRRRTIGCSSPAARSGSASRWPRSCDRLPGPQGDQPAGGRERPLHGSGALDAGAREPGRADPDLGQPVLCRPEGRTRQCRRESRPQGSGHAQPRPSGDRLGEPCAGYGVEARRVDDLDSFLTAFQAGLSVRGPFLIEVTLD
jgi:acetolactate synthase-1/2/3 large subunit